MAIFSPARASPFFSHRILLVTALLFFISSRSITAIEGEPDRETGKEGTKWENFHEFSFFLTPPINGISHTSGAGTVLTFNLAPFLLIAPLGSRFDLWLNSGVETAYGSRSLPEAYRRERYAVSATLPYYFRQTTDRWAWSGFSVGPGFSLSKRSGSSTFLVYGGSLRYTRITGSGWLFLLGFSLVIRENIDANDIRDGDFGAVFNFGLAYRIY